MTAKKTTSIKSIKGITSTTSKGTKKTANLKKLAKVATAMPIKKARDTRGTSGARGTRLSAEVFDLSGKVVESMSLPFEVFGAKVNKVLLAQAVRIYLANQRTRTSATKTRGEVAGSTRKIYRQKGTGRARHGGIRAPIFVKGGTAHGPKSRDLSLSMPQKMRKVALSSALSARLGEGDIKVISGLIDLKPKTKIIAETLLSILGDTKRENILIVTSSDLENVSRAMRNLKGISYTAAVRLNPYEVVSSRKIILMKEAVEALSKRFA